jgi:c-di-GMP-binding flagellar brake protein YcgR
MSRCKHRVKTYNSKHVFGNEENAVQHMEANKILNRRKSFRIDTKMSGHYSLGGKKGLWGKCTVVNFSREGTGILFNSSKEIPVGSTMYLKLEAPTQKKPITLKGTLAWIKKTHDGFSGGIKW